MGSVTKTNKEGKRMIHQKLLSVMALVFLAALLQGCPLQVKLVDGCDNMGGIQGEGNCWTHKMGQWPNDGTNYPSCAVWDSTHDSWVCNSPGVACSTAAVPSGHCTLNPSSGICKCQCL